MNTKENFLRSLFLLLGFVVIGILLRANFEKMFAHGASQGSGYVVISGTTSGSWVVPVTVTGQDAFSGVVVGSKVLNLAISVGNPLSCLYFTATPSIIFPPQKTQLQWNCPGATTCTITRDTGGTVTPAPAPKDLGTTFDGPTQNTVYTLSCNNGFLTAQLLIGVQTGLPAVRETIPP